MTWRTIVLGLIGAVGAAVAYALLLRRRTEGRSSASATEAQEYHCDCGQSFRVVGSGRHRVYWLADAPQSEPVMSDSCPSCGRALPRDPDGAALSAEATP